MTKARSDAVSMISTFRFRKDKGGFADLGPVTIQTALVTGSAATNLKEEAPAVATVQVTGEAIATPGKLADIILSNLDKPGREKDRQGLKNLFGTGTPCKDMKPDAQGTFETHTRAGTGTFTVPLCEAVQQRLR